MNGLDRPVGCPGDDELARWLGAGAHADDDGLHLHVDGCPHCTAVLVELGRLYEPDDPHDQPGDDPAARYRIDGPIGAGGMGVVYQGYDRWLERPVALKCLHPSAADAPGLLARLRREARLLARINHPNVVAVFDVSLVDDEILVVMELVEGSTLRQWLRQRPRRPSEVLDVFVAAGRGLAAAHRAGLVHRDFKPDNVLVGLDGRVRVADLGLAHHVAVASSSSEPASVERSHYGGSERVVTSGAEIVGTTAYMAPEQRSGGPVDHRADQYAFAISLFEALYGERPGTPPSLTPSARRVPRAVAGVLRRAWAEDPGQRWPDMARLLEALRRPASRGRWPLVSAALLGAALAWQTTPLAQPVADCAPASRAPIHVQRIRARLARQVGPELAEHTAARLEAQAEQLGGLERGLCEASGDPTLLHARQVCLAEHWAELDATLEALEQLKGEALYEAAGAVASLPEPSGCRRPVPRTWPRGEPRTAVEQVRRQLARARGLRRAGRPRHAERVLEQAEAELGGIDFEPVWAELLLDRGRLYRARNRWAEAADDLERSYWAATRSGAFALAEQAATELVVARLDDGAPLSEVEGWIRHGQAAHDRAGEEADGFMLETARGRLESAQGNYARALPHFERARAEAKARYGAEHPTHWSATHNLAIASDAVGDYARAIELATAACDGRRALFGAQHPAVAGCLRTMANAEARLGALDAAEVHVRRAIEILERILGPDDAELVSYLDSLAILLGEQHRDEDAIALLRRSVTILDAALGPTHLETVRSRRQLGNALRRGGRVAEARAVLGDAATWVRHNLPEDHPLRVAVLGDLANLAIVQGDPDEAEPLLHEALAQYRRRHPRGHPSTAVTLLQLGHVAGLRGRFDESIEWFDRADAMLVSTAGRHSPDRWAVLLAKADALLELRRDRQVEATCHEVLASMGSDGPTEGPWRRLGELAILAGRHDDALAALERSRDGAEARGEAEASAHAELLRAHALIAAGRPRQGQAALERFEAIPHVDHEELRARVERTLRRAPATSLTATEDPEAAAPR